MPEAREGSARSGGGAPAPTSRTARHAKATAKAAPTSRAPKHRTASAPARSLIVALVTAGLVWLLGGTAFWLCVPAALLAASWTQGRLDATITAAAVVITAAIPTLATRAHRPSILWALIIPEASVLVLVNLRERLAAERDRLKATAATDPLTGLQNRRTLQGRIDYEIARHNRVRRRFAVVTFDLDGFKLLNDRFGHGAGDDLLRDVAEALTRAVRDQDTVARIGGDEFLVLAPETDHGGAERLLSRAAASVGRVTAGIDSLSASAGTAIFPDDGGTAQELLKAADARLLEAKRAIRAEHPHRRRAA